jgi:peptide/nickel transport system substrate-binding protein
MLQNKNLKILILACISILLTIVLAGCQPKGATGTTQSAPTQAQAEVTLPQATQSPATPTPAQAMPKPVEPTAVPATEVPKEKSIVILIAEEPPSFNAMISDTGYDALVMELVMLGMTDVDPDGKVFPELAAELPTVENGGVVTSEDGATMTVTWKMRKDVQWQDGVSVTADDVLFTWEAIKNPETGSWIPGIDYIDRVEKIDDYSFFVSYNTIYPGYLTQFGGEQLVVWPAHYCDAAQGFVAWECARQPLSDGPYTLVEWVTADHLSFTRNPNYYQPGKPLIDNIIVKVVPDAAVRKTMMIEGDADVIMWTTEPIINDLKDAQNVKVSISPYNRWVMRLFMNQAARGTLDSAATPHPILADVRVRKAIRMAIDVDTISKEIFYGYDKPVWTEFYRPPYACDVPKPVYDPEAAAALLEEAGWKDQDGDGVRECHGCLHAKEGYLMEMELATYTEYGEPLLLTQQLIGEMLGKIGMRLKLTTLEGNVMWADSASGGTEQNGNFDIDLWDDGYAGVDPTDFLWELYSADAAQPDNGWNIDRWVNDDFNTLLSEAYTLDETQRQQTFCQMARLFDDEVPVLLLFTTINAEAYSARLEGVQSTTNDLVTWNVADWDVVK